jgi:hypothetical protein
LNDIQALPTKIDEYYKAILLRYANDVDGDDLLSGLHTFAAAKDYLTMSHLGLINGIGSATLMRIGSTLKEVLYENPLTEEVLDYQLFHESFREYLMKEQAREVSAAQQRIIAFCAGWKELKGEGFRRGQRVGTEALLKAMREGVQREIAEEAKRFVAETPQITELTPEAARVAAATAELKRVKQMTSLDKLNIAFNTIQENIMGARSGGT